MAARFHVGEWQVEPELNTVSRDGRTLHLEPKAMRVLVTLIENRGEVVKKEKLFALVWPDTFVTDDVLTRAISAIRHSLDDDPKHPRYIETIPKSGYRLLASVTLESSTQENRPRRAWRRTLLLGGIAVLIVATVIYVSRSDRSSRDETRSHIRSLAVLPLSNLSGDPGEDYFVDGLTDELTTRLSKISALRVISHASAMHYKGTQKAPSEVARELDVDAILDGSVLRSGDRVRINARLVEARTDKNVWAESYRRDIRDVLLLQADIATAVAREIQLQINPRESEKLRKLSSASPEAYDAYLKGNFYWGKFTDPAMRKAISSYQQAIKIDPNYAAAYAGLADSYHELTDASPNEVIPQSRAAALKALELDETLAEAHSALGWVKWIYDWDWTGAEHEFQRALQLASNDRSTHGKYAEYLDSMGRFTEAQTQREIAMKLSPVEPILYTNTGEHFLYTRQFDKAIQSFNESLELDPDFAVAHFWLAQVYGLKGMWNESVDHLSKAVALRGDRALAAKISSTYTKSGYRSANRLLLEGRRMERARGNWLSFADDAYFYVILGEKEPAIGALNRAMQDRDPRLSALQVDPSFDPIRSDPRFQRLIRQIGLQQ